MAHRVEMVLGRVVVTFYGDDGNVGHRADFDPEYADTFAEDLAEKAARARRWLAEEGN